VDAVHCLETPEFFMAIGIFYENFHQLSDDEVVKLLAEAEELQRNVEASGAS
jgi:putative phosphoribosyl transferase